MSIVQKPTVRYSDTDLAEFEALIEDKLAHARQDLKHLKSSITRQEFGDINTNSLKTLEDGADTLEKEQLNQLAARTQKYIMQLEKALVRIKNGTYGVCVTTGKLIQKERLKLVPHTQHSIEAKTSGRA